MLIAFGIPNQLTVTPPSANPSAVVDVETQTKMGRITIWQYGESFFEIISCMSGKIIYSTYRDILNYVDLDEEVAAFCTAIATTDMD